MLRLQAGALACEFVSHVRWAKAALEHIHAQEAEDTPSTPPSLCGSGRGGDVLTDTMNGMTARNSAICARESHSSACAHLAGVSAASTNLSASVAVCGCIWVPSTNVATHAASITMSRHLSSLHKRSSSDQGVRTVFRLASECDDRVCRDPVKTALSPLPASSFLQLASWRQANRSDQGQMKKLGPQDDASLLGDTLTFWQARMLPRFFGSTGRTRKATRRRCTHWPPAPAWAAATLPAATRASSAAA